MRVMTAIVASAAAFLAAAPADAATLVDMTNISAQVSTPSSTLDPTQSFTATSASTVLTIAGYDVPASFVLVNISLANILSPSTNILGAHWTYTPAGCSPLAGEGNLGTRGTYDLSFRGGCVGSYDSFSQTINTVVGQTYNLSYLFTLVRSGGRTGTATPNGLLITANDPAVIEPVPEPATWAMMLLGLGGLGFAMRRRHSSTLELS